MNAVETQMTARAALPADSTDGNAEAPTGAAITGFPGGAGVIEGRARLLDTAEKRDELETGEVLVIPAATAGWTPVFPQAAAVVTDVGGQLSDAAIVARELGVPVVVDCGDATARLHTGDWVRVNGGTGTVEVLHRRNAA